jgi:hypothetical protein
MWGKRIEKLLEAGPDVFTGSRHLRDPTQLIAWARQHDWDSIVEPSLLDVIDAFQKTAGGNPQRAKISSWSFPEFRRQIEATIESLKPLDAPTVNKQAGR